MRKDIDQLKTVRDNFPTLDISDLLVGMPSDYLDMIKLEYSNIANSYVAYILIKTVRAWCNQKILDITNSSSLDNISLEDCIILWEY